LPQGDLIALLGSAGNRLLMTRDAKSRTFSTIHFADFANPP